MNTYLNALTNENNYCYTENGGLAHNSTRSYLQDMFGLAAAYRTRSDADCIVLFKDAYKENPEYALKCLFYVRAVREGQGERRYFKTVYKWLAGYDVDAARRNMKFIPELGRWDDLFCLVGTDLEEEMFLFIKNQLATDVMSKTPSLLAKWLPSENTSSMATRSLAYQFRKYLGWTAKQYRKTLSILRARIKVLERLMSENRWDEIEFDKIPSKAGFKYRNTFAHKEVTAARYAAFMASKETKVNAKVLYPYECVAAARNRIGSPAEREAINKYWDNLANYFAEKTFNGLAVVDVSGSMYGCEASAPINVAISLGLYCADKAKGPFHDHFITFSSRPQLVRVTGVDFVDKVNRMGHADWGMNTNLEATFEMLLKTAVQNHVAQEDLPENLIIISDMEIDAATNYYARGNRNTMMENMRQKWARYGYKMPKLVYWNVQARNNRFLDNDPNATYISGFSPTIFEQLMTGKTGYELMMEALNKPCFADIK